MSRRSERVANVIRAIVADAIQHRLNDPRIEPLTSVTHVHVSADLSVADVYVSVMAQDSRRQLSLQALQHAAGRLRSLVARQVALRQVPLLRFRLDESIQGSFRTVQQLDRLMAELGARAPHAGPSPDSETTTPPAARGPQEPAAPGTGSEDPGGDIRAQSPADEHGSEQEDA